MGIASNKRLTRMRKVQNKKSPRPVIYRHVHTNPAGPPPFLFCKGYIPHKKQKTKNRKRKRERSRLLLLLLLLLQATNITKII